jgi:hypothetical protein
MTPLVNGVDTRQPNALTRLLAPSIMKLKMKRLKKVISFLLPNYGYVNQ